MSTSLLHHSPSAWPETVLRLKAGEPAPVGYEILRLIGHIQAARMDGTTSYDDVYVVAARRVAE